MDPEKKSNKKWRVSYQSTRIWHEGKLKGRGVINLTYKKKLVINLFAEIYHQGRWPWFNNKETPTKYVINIPAPMIKDLMDEIEMHGQRIQKKGNHKWTKRKYKAREVDKVVQTPV